ncbi:hypothetical protein HHK36_000524 [Tetracentron sinense]|uniref:PGG domain-containing protein n=1 Tax=Tetracentron sinense TaxID=13715 RepID=A0A834ZSC1_TETSI|nr:hypothetical protein HHK36_000524 [Tetracentron sinense]
MAGSTIQSTVVTCRGVYKAAVQGNWDTLRKFYTREPTSPINVYGDTVLHVLALYRHAKIVHELLELPLPIHGLATNNCRGNIALHEAARVGSVEIAKAMVRKEEGLVTTRNPLGETPLYWAAAYGQKEVLHFLAKKNGSENGLRRNDGCTVLHAAMMGEFYGLAQEIMGLYPDLAYSRNEIGATALHLLAQSPSSFRSGTIYTHKSLGSSGFIPLHMLAIIIYLCIPSNAYEQLLEGCTEDLENPCDARNEVYQGLLRSQGNLISGSQWLREIDDAKQKNNIAVKLAIFLIKAETTWVYGINAGGDPSHTWISGPIWNNISISHGKNKIEDPLLKATKLGITEVVVNILEEFPEAIELLDENGKNILHLAVENRHTGVFEFLKSKKFPISRMVSDVDKEGNTALHLAAKLGTDYQPRNVPGAPQQMLWETFWFKRVKQVSLPHLFPLQNSNGQTAEELFIGTHRNLLNLAEKWIRDTMNLLILISVLVATINFTALLTVPGGFESKDGLPVLVNDISFTAFMGYVSAGLLNSLITLAVAISAQLSHLQQDDFYISLPFKLIVAIAAFFYSIIDTIMVFAQALILQINKETTPTEYAYVAFGISLACCVISLVYIDIVYPVFHHMIVVLFY